MWVWQDQTLSSKSFNRDSIDIVRLGLEKRKNENDVTIFQNYTNTAVKKVTIFHQYGAAFVRFLHSFKKEHLETKTEDQTKNGIDHAGAFVGKCCKNSRWNFVEVFEFPTSLAKIEDTLFILVAAI